MQNPNRANTDNIKRIKCDPRATEEKKSELFLFEIALKSIKNLYFVHILRAEHSAKLRRTEKIEKEM